MFISGKKYACKSCINGHRSSACRHTDRPLFEIKKKGRPVTQCKHCRELRKTEKVHGKCESKVDQSFLRKGCQSAAFPSGLPEALHATVSFQSSVEGTSSDSDHDGSTIGHQCKSGDPCKCVLLRAWAGLQSPSLNAMISSDSSSGHPFQSPSAYVSSQTRARIAALRPVLPRPAQQGMVQSSGPVHDQSMRIPHSYPSNRHDTPYMRYGMAPQSLTTKETTSSILSFPSLCSCGDGACPGCVQHNFSILPALPASASCLNLNRHDPPPYVFPSNTALSLYNESPQNDVIDDWLRQMFASKSNSTDGVPMQGENNGWDSFQGWNSQLGIDPRLLQITNPTIGGSGSAASLDVPRGRSPSLSSQSSNHGGPDTHSGSIDGRNSGGRPMQGMFPNPQGVRSAPQLDIHPNMLRGSSSSASLSTSPRSDWFGLGNDVGALAVPGQ